MFATQVSNLTDVRQSKLLQIAINVTDRFFFNDNTKIHLSEIKEYQVWRDRHHVALINRKTRRLIVLGQIAPKSKPILQTDKIVNLSLWKNIQQHHSLLRLDTSTEQLDRAWQFFRPLDPTILNLYQIQPCST
ncbi:MAG: hypothetical protein QNJ72_02195 [Pleurocapsa sp. MO_226.B13]|nr:hypothetical protein [Pleurocapsa sp. MO_226.B13]